MIAILINHCVNIQLFWITKTYIYIQRLTIVEGKYNLLYAHYLEHTFDNLIYQKSGQELSLSKKRTKY